MNPSAANAKAVVLGSTVDPLSWDAALQRLHVWSQCSQSRYVCICNVHTIVTASLVSGFSAAINDADMTLPGGMPVAWYMRMVGVRKQERIDASELMWRLCEDAAASTQAVFFFGSSPRVLRRLSVYLQRRLPRLRIAGTYSPPYRRLTVEEDERLVAELNASGARLVFVALGCPKQELWMAEHRGRIRAVMIGVGAAFDYYAGTVKRAPLWMQEVGLEWAFRLAQEPQRLWRRYLVAISMFIFLSATQLLKAIKQSKLRTSVPPR
jgi:N-acetylglucosaminyldiphosphoundecaprenol N-acetyl-beta-D-mannosaminyltransferase